MSIDERRGESALTNGEDDDAAAEEAIDESTGIDAAELGTDGEGSPDGIGLDDEMCDSGSVGITSGTCDLVCCCDNGVGDC